MGPGKRAIKWMKVLTALFEAIGYNTTGPLSCRVASHSFPIGKSGSVSGGVQNDSHCRSAGGHSYKICSAVSSRRYPVIRWVGLEISIAVRNVGISSAGVGEPQHVP